MYCTELLSRLGDKKEKFVLKLGGEHHYVYILRCADDTLYTGWTTHLEERVAVHNAGKGAKYTKNRRPVKLVYFECLESKPLALRREYAIKRLTRQEKLELIHRSDK